MRVSPLATAVSVELGTVMLEARAAAAAAALNLPNLRRGQRRCDWRNFDLAFAGRTLFGPARLGSREGSRQVKTIRILANDCRQRLMDC